MKKTVNKMNPPDKMHYAALKIPFEMYDKLTHWRQFKEGFGDWGSITALFDDGNKAELDIYSYSKHDKPLVDMTLTLTDASGYRITDEPSITLNVDSILGNFNYAEAFDMKSRDGELYRVSIQNEFTKCRDGSMTDNDINMVSFALKLLGQELSSHRLRLFIDNSNSNVYVLPDDAMLVRELRQSDDMPCYHSDLDSRIYTDTSIFSDVRPVPVKLPLIAFDPIGTKFVRKG